MQLSRITTFFVLIALSGCASFSRSDQSAQKQQAPDSRQVFLEHEVSRLSEKLSALETKINAMEAQIAHNLRAGKIGSAGSNINGPAASGGTAAENLPVKLPGEIKPKTIGIESSFRKALESYQSGRYDDASMRFYEISKNNASHLLASHALYWAADSHAKRGEWEMATRRWQQLESQYPRSAFITETLAGLAGAFEKQGNLERANHYKNVLYKHYPDAPATMNLLTSDNRTTDSADVGGRIE